MIAITGVHGAFPTRLLRRLDEDNRIARLVLIDRRPVVAPLMKAASYRVDLSEPNADGHMADIFRRERVTAVIHLAFKRRPQADPAPAHDLESVGTMHVIGGVAQAAGVGSPLRHLLVVSSAVVYGADPKNPAVLTESDLLRGCPGYSFVEEKVDAERQLDAARSRIHIPITVLRPSFILDRGHDGLLSSYLDHLIVPTVWGYDPLLQIVHAEDVVEACRIALERRPNAAYNIAGRGVLPLGTVIRLAGKAHIDFLACAAPAALDVMWYAGLGAVPGGHVPFLKYSLVLDGQRAGRDLEFRPRRSSVETLEYFIGRRLAWAA